VRLRGPVDPIFAEQPDDVLDLLPSLLRDGDLLLTLGAGSVARLAPTIRERFSAPVH
jgi:UDP-N-acetylmuramate--alanine ligase